MCGKFLFIELIIPQIRKELKDIFVTLFYIFTLWGGWLEGSIAFYVLLCYTIYIKGFCTEKGQKSQKSVKMQNAQKPLCIKGFWASF